MHYSAVQQAIHVDKGLAGSQGLRGKGSTRGQTPMEPKCDKEWLAYGVQVRQAAPSHGHTGEVVGGGNLSQLSFVPEAG